MVGMCLASVSPQWSPLSTSGATNLAGRGEDAQGGAAMEPALDERGDQHREWGIWGGLTGRNGARSRRAGRRVAGRRPGAPGTAAMEPALDERGDLPAAKASSSVLAPQWSPLSTS